MPSVHFVLVLARTKRGADSLCRELQLRQCILFRKIVIHINVRQCMRYQNLSANAIHGDKESCIVSGSLMFAQ